MDTQSFFIPEIKKLLPEEVQKLKISICDLMYLPKLKFNDPIVKMYNLNGVFLNIGDVVWCTDSEGGIKKTPRIIIK